MTIICAYRDQKTGRTWLGSNSRSLVGDTVIPGDRSKWSVYGDWAVSFTGKGVMTDAIAAKGDEFPGTEENVYRVTDFLRKCYRDAEIGKEDEGAIDFDTSGLLVHRAGRIYDVDCRLSVEPINPDTLWASGSGMEYALGAAFAYAPRADGPEDLMKTALEAAIALDSGCPGTPRIEEF